MRPSELEGDQQQPPIQSRIIALGGLANDTVIGRRDHPRNAHTFGLRRPTS